MSMLKYPIFITAMVIKENTILKKISKYCRVRGIMFPIYFQMGQERKIVWDGDRFIEREIANGARYKYESQ